MRYRLDPNVEAFDDGRVLLGGDPTRLMRLSDAGARFVVSRLLAPSTPGERQLVERLADASMAHPIAEPAGGVAAVVPVVIVPVKDRPEALGLCLASLVASGVREIVVVDDGSADAKAHAEVASRHGARLVRRGSSGGPSAARMAGWRSLDPLPEIVAFVDSDVVVTLERWDALLVHFSAPECGLVAPRVVHRPGPTAVDRYEALASPLDLGPDPAPIRAGSRVSYVPSAAVVVRSSAFEEVDGFDEALDVGEDVDLLWRLADAGWLCRYEPAVTVVHEGRSKLPELLHRRFDYGRSAAVLDQRHPGALPPLRGSRWSGAVAVLVATGHPVLAAAVVVGNVEAMARKVGAIPDARRVASRLVVRGHLGFLRQAARALLRPWFPVTIVASLLSRRVRRVAAVALLAEPIVTHRRRAESPSFLVWTALCWADDLAYSAGVWVGCVRARRFGPLLPDVRRWAGRSASGRQN
ncbi:MAG: mycofactocin biosynthesis glycosyltransferase MftF [Microthrixaceae bacterium]|nr:mycofactocin biosynthesis glycosyltransferase MftF [Microthrixaceae bacterium]